MKRLNFKSVKEYYEYMSQSNCFAPKFDDLAENAKNNWEKEFEEYRKDK